jgi:hypothetical protein
LHDNVYSKRDTYVDSVCQPRGGYNLPLSGAGQGSLVLLLSG